MRSDMERENKERRNDIQRQERRLVSKEENLDRKIEAFEKKEEGLTAKENKLNATQEKVDALYQRQLQELERMSGLSSEDAKKELLAVVHDDVEHDAAVMIKEAEQRAKDEADKKAREIISLAIQRCAADQVAETTVSVVNLPNDEMKGRIIGREGRNIRVLEQTLGVDLVIDDTPEVITVSCFNPIRREIAKRTLEALVKDGRIQPGRIEELAEKFKNDVDNDCMRAGNDACNRLGIVHMNRELVAILGKLKYRTSYGQNVLDHSVEVGYLCGIMAAELGLDQNLARRAGLLHDIGKAVDYEQEGSHAALGGQLARKYNEPDVVVNSIESHHGDVPATSVIAHLVQAADTLSAARPGARSETLETYTKRITQLEDLANSFDGVEKAYAMQAGREIRVMVIPDKVSDADAIKMAQELREKIEQTMTYPGQIKVNIIREYRATETAK